MCNKIYSPKLVIKVSCRAFLCVGRKTYYSRHEVNQALESDLHWVEQTKAEFELIIFQSDLEGVKKKVEKTVKACSFDLIITEPDKSINGNQMVLFIGRKKTEPSM
jgi:hypothetical protein